MYCRYLTSQQTAVYSGSDVGVTISTVTCYKKLKPHTGREPSTNPGLSPRRPVFMSHVEPKINIVAGVYSCFSNIGYVVFFFNNTCFEMPFLCLCHRSAVYLMVPLSR